jgi:murein L,D-transpeptidase YcbB/YkuD
VIEDDRRNGGKAWRNFGLRGAATAAAALLVVGAGGCDRIEALVGLGPAQVSARALQAAATEPEVKAFYERRQWRAAWSDSEAKALIRALEDASRHGLDASRFTSIIRSAEGDAARDAELTMAALSYGRALAYGAVDPKKVHGIYTLPRPKLDLAADLEQALGAGSVSRWLASLPPQDPEYAALSKAYVAYKAQAEQAKGEPIPAGPVIRPGAADARVPAVIQRLMVAGYLPPETQVGADAVFSRPMSEALKSLQRDAKLPPTGRVDEATVQALNEAAAERARQLAVNMERRRWLSREVPGLRIDVNTAAAELTYFRDGQAAWTSRVVVGDPENQTPALGSEFKQLVVNPPWNVPDGIAEEEILPKGPGYLASENMYVENGRVVQRPGPDSALGLVKFDMQNPYAIYLHDTPAKSIFQSQARHRSHGCTRVEGAVEFARLLATERGKGEAFDAALQSGETKVVELGEAIPVRLLYHTAYLDKSGRLIFADDPYAWDDKVGRALGLEPSRRRPNPPVAHLLGP